MYVRQMKKLHFTIAAALLLCACGTKQTQQQCPYQEDSFPIHGSVLKNVDSMEYYNALAAQGDARAQYIMAASYYCAGQAQPLPHWENSRGILSQCRHRRKRGER